LQKQFLSENVINALKAANKKSIATLGFLGATGGYAREHCKKYLLVPSLDAGRIQEVHITAGHALMELIENKVIDYENH
jgi:D-sedoheptulose 7-phosphate isomerase